MKIGKLSKISGVSQRMIRYYEEQGLMSPSRSGSNYRHYTQDDVCRLGRIRILQNAGLTLKVIHSLLPCMSGESVQFEPCSLVLSTLLEEKAKLDARIRILSESRALLESYMIDLQVDRSLARNPETLTLIEREHLESPAEQGVR